ncbi:MAG: NAD(+) diphosphatase [Desulfobulbaceae bacterium]|nr:MAG: NAD(+) diphosphatase [Desulfobulbaceae bacterium]
MCVHEEINPGTSHNRKMNQWFGFAGELVAMMPGSSHPVPLLTNAPEPPPGFRNIQLLGTNGPITSYAAEIIEKAELSDDLELYNPRALLPIVDPELFSLLGRAKQIIHFYRTHRFCGSCGKEMTNMPREIARTCEVCGLTNYPRLSPVVIMSVKKDDTILLARSPHFPKSMFSCLAGFVEPGETVEQAVAREVYEECGIGVKDIRYVQSQPWPFPHSLMLGFTSNYHDGEIKVDQVEIEQAAWYSKHNLPVIPHGNAIAGQLIRMALDL